MIFQNGVEKAFTRAAAAHRDGEERDGPERGDGGDGDGLGDDSRRLVSVSHGEPVWRRFLERERDGDEVTANRVVRNGRRGVPKNARPSLAETFRVGDARRRAVEREQEKANR